MRRHASFLAGLLFAVACGASSSHGTAGDGGAGDDATGPGDDVPNDSGSPPADGGTSDGPSSGTAGAKQGTDAGGGDGGIVLPSGRSFPDTNASIALLVDQLPTMTTAQMQFSTSHFVGTEKQLLPVTQQLRAMNPAFLVLHYHLSMWQSAPGVDFIINGTSWGNDYPTVTTNETWFWHNTSNERVSSNVDGKLLMDITLPAFQ